jgi:hypothetical protein
MSKTPVVHIGNHEALDRLIQKTAFKNGHTWSLGGKTYDNQGMKFYGQNYCLSFGDSLLYCDDSYYEGKPDYYFVTVPEFLDIVSKPKVVPFQKTVKLNDEYVAYVTKENVKVRCQTFSHHAIAELYALTLQAKQSNE